MSKFTVKSSIKHDGKMLPLGAVIELDDEDANGAYLVERKVLENAPDDAEVTVAKKAAKATKGA